jgi:hypothetical protein
MTKLDHDRIGEWIDRDSDNKGGRTLFALVTTIDESRAYSECQGVLSEHGR